MTSSEISDGPRFFAALAACTRGATAVTYVLVLGAVTLVGGAAFEEFGSSVRNGVRAETKSASQANGEDVDGPTGSLAAEVATAGAEALVVQGSWALTAKAGSLGLAAARRTQRGRGASAFDDQRPRGSESTRDPDPTPAQRDPDPPPAQRDPAPIIAQRDPEPINAQRDPAPTPAQRDPAPSIAQRDPAPTPAQRDPEPIRDQGPTIAAATRDDGPGCRGAQCQKESGCFEANTPVATFEGPRAIEAIRVGDRVRTSNSNAATSAVDASTWRNVRLHVPDAHGGVELELLRPAEWVAGASVAVGATVQLEASEIVPKSEAIVLAVTAAPRVSAGPGRVVTGTFTRVARDLAELDLGNAAPSVVGTTSHPFFSSSRGQWVPLGELVPGELLRTPGGVVPVVSLRSLPREARVYNLEVEGDHEYFVSAREVLVHNTCPPVRFRDQIPPPAPGSYRETYYNVGSASAAMITTPGLARPNHPQGDVRPVVVIVDAGAQLGTSAAQMDAIAQRIQNDIAQAGPNAEIHVVLSHGDQDHSILLPRIVQGRQVASLTHGGRVSDYPPAVRTVIGNLEQAGTRVRSPHHPNPNQRIATRNRIVLGDGNHPEGHVILDIDAVEAGRLGRDGSTNNNGLAAGLRYGNGQHSVFTGDAQGLTEIALGGSLAANGTPVSSMTMSHHGSRTKGSNGLPFARHPQGSGLYEQAQPSVVVAQSGTKHNFPQMDAYKNASPGLSFAPQGAGHTVEVGMGRRPLRAIHTSQPLFSTRSNGQISRDSNAQGPTYVYVESRDRNRATRPPVQPPAPTVPQRRPREEDSDSDSNDYSDSDTDMGSQSSSEPSTHASPDHDHDMLDGP